MADVDKTSGLTKVTARIGKGDTASEAVSVNIDLGKNLQDAVKKFGEDIVFSHYHGSAVIAAQSRIRAAIAEDHAAGRKPNQTKVTEALKDWKPGMKKPGATRLEKAEKLVPQMTTEERAALIKKLQEMGKAA